VFIFEWKSALKCITPMFGLACSAWGQRVRSPRGKLRNHRSEPNHAVSGQSSLVIWIKRSALVIQKIGGIERRLDGVERDGTLTLTEVEAIGRASARASA